MDWADAAARIGEMDLVASTLARSRTTPGAGPPGVGHVVARCRLVLVAALHGPAPAGRGRGDRTGPTEASDSSKRLIRLYRIAISGAHARLKIYPRRNRPRAPADPDASSKGLISIPESKRTS